MFTCHSQCDYIKLMYLGLPLFVLDDVSCLKQIGLGWCYLLSADTKSPCWYAYATAYAAFHRPILLSQGAPTLADTTWRRKMHWSPCQCTHAMTNVCMPWLMLHCNAQSCLPYVHMPFQMCAGLGWCSLPLTDIACQSIQTFGYIPSYYYVDIA